MPRIDPILVERALSEATKRAANLDYFFESISSPDWIEPLQERGLFAEPPALEVDEMAGYVRAPAWSASRYLARVAGMAPEKVLRVIEGISTDNDRIHDDFITAAVAMPAKEAAAVASEEAKWIGEHDNVIFLRAENVVDLVAHLTELGETETAVRLAHSLFAPRIEESDDPKLPDTPQPRLPEWEYDTQLRRLARDVTPSAPIPILQELVLLLGLTLEAMRVDPDDDARFDTVSRIWRVRVSEEPHRGRTGEPENSLVSAVRDAARVIRRDRLADDRTLVDVLTSRREEILRRIAMHVLAEEPEADIEVVAGLLFAGEGLSDPEPSVEYRELLSTNAHRLPHSALEALLDVIRAGPDMDEFRERYEASGYGDLALEDAELHYAARWRASRLRLLRAALDDDWTREYEELIALVGDAQLPTSFEVHTFVGPTSPLPADELSAMSDGELVRYLHSWKPDPHQWAGPSIDGLARELGELAKNDAHRVSRLAPSLADLEPYYIQWSIQGLEQALRDGKTVLWEPIFGLLQTVTGDWRRRTDLPALDGDDEARGDWMLGQLMSFLETALTRDSDLAVPLSERESTWRLITSVAGHPDPTAERERRYGGSNMDPVTLSLNSVRTRAIRAAVAYAIWLRNQAATSEGEWQTLRVEAPEVVELLTSHLDPEIDPSVAVRGAIGQYYANLFALDKDWAASSLAQLLFPKEDTPLREAGWGGHIVFSRPFKDVFAALRPVYRRSAELAGHPGHGFRWLNGDPRERLGEHLAAFYWQGVLELDDELVSTYWGSATPELRRHVLSFLGRSAQEVQRFDDRLAQRLMSFWTYASERGAGTKELGSFAAWFGAAGLPLEWRVDVLGRLLSSGIKPEPDFFVVEALPSVALQSPGIAVSLFRQLLETESEPWSARVWRAELESVLRAALESDDPSARTVARETTDWLGALGHQEFRHLLE